jgi:hypothetical protein
VVVEVGVVGDDPVVVVVVGDVVEPAGVVGVVAVVEVGVVGLSAGVVEVGVAVVVVAVGEFVVSPLSFSCVWICCWTLATSEAMAAGVPPAPSCGRALSSFKSASSSLTKAGEGWDFRVTTI